MKSLRTLNHFMLASLLAGAGASAMAQNSATVAQPAPSGMHERHMGKHDPAEMQAWKAKHQAELKAKLKLLPAQEAAWSTYIAAMQTPAHGESPTAEQHAQMGKLTTPERIEKRRAMRSQHMAEMTAAMDKRDAATKAFYAALTPEQQKVFDGMHSKHPGHGNHGGQALHKN